MNTIYRPLQLSPKGNSRKKHGKAPHGRSNSKDIIGTKLPTKLPTTQVVILKKVSIILNRKVVTIKKSGHIHTYK